jgi:lariat debranching enzyme
VQIAVEGCMHGELDIVYDTLRRLEEAEGIKIDLLLCCGDFQVPAPRPLLCCGSAE